ncbi:hypothetical protein E2C01_065107 [Portunus trituberculatus]|uniref:Uncharacterized protein n=1 Tax=Portunus trituberculatus TaxID=210409 RepID=A0A5B7HLM9_PORTR|nr:hypothetical protein [Portunus trituberculatus]
MDRHSVSFYASRKPSSFLKLFNTTLNSIPPLSVKGTDSHSGCIGVLSLGFYKMRGKFYYTQMITY